MMKHSHQALPAWLEDHDDDNSTHTISLNNPIHVGINDHTPISPKPNNSAAPANSLGSLDTDGLRRKKLVKGALKMVTMMLCCLMFITAIMGLGKSIEFYCLLYKV